jgi:hypothetical protein
MHTMHYAAKDFGTSVLAGMFFKGGVFNPWQFHAKKKKFFQKL